MLAFYAGAVIVPILLAGAIGLRGDDLVYLIQADLFTCGIASIIQAVGFWKVGVRLPLVQGVTFVAVAPMIAIGTSKGGGVDGLLHIYAIVDEELEAGLRSIAAPIHDSAGAVTAAVNLSVQAARTTVADMKRRLLPPLRDTAGAIECDLGAGPRRGR